MEQLTNWYVRLNRGRLKGHSGLQEQTAAVNTLYEVMFTMTRAMTPFTPFFTEYLYKNLRNVLPEEQRKESSLPQLYVLVVLVCIEVRHALKTKRPPHGVTAKPETIE